jgi:hypothetical protein
MTLRGWWFCLPETSTVCAVGSGETPLQQAGTPILWTIQDPSEGGHALVEKRLLVAHQFGLCVAHMGCATIATQLVQIYQWRISICATHS